MAVREIVTVFTNFYENYVVSTAVVEAQAVFIIENVELFSKLLKDVEDWCTDIIFMPVSRKKIQQSK